MAKVDNQHIDDLKEFLLDKFKTNDTDHRDILHRVDEKLELILAQTTKTNGRVSSLEAWKNQVGGAWGLIKYLGAGNIVLLLGLWAQHLMK